MVKDINLQIQESQQTLTKTNARKNQKRHIIVKILKIKHKEKILSDDRKMTLYL